MIIERDGKEIELTREEMVKAYFEVQDEFDLEDIITLGIDDNDDLPPMSKEVKEKIAKAALSDYQEDLISSEQISNARWMIAQDLVKIYLMDHLPVIGAYPIANTASINVHYIDQDLGAYVSLNNTDPDWSDIEILEGDAGDEPAYGFVYHGIEVPLNEVVRV